MSTVNLSAGHDVFSKGCTPCSGLGLHSWKESSSLDTNRAVCAVSFELCPVHSLSFRLCISMCASALWAVHFWLCTLCAVASLEEFHMTACHQPQIAFSLTCHKLNCLQPPKKKISLAVSFKESTSGPNMLPVCDPLVISRPVDTWVVLSQISCPQKHLKKMIFWPSKQIIAN